MEVVMPGGDGTGPMGMGSTTGRGAGFCAGYAGPGFMNGIPGRGGMGLGRRRGRGFGMGRGMRNGRGTPVAAQPVARPQMDELTTLKNEAGYFEETLQSINKRISELEAKKK